MPFGAGLLDLLSQGGQFVSGLQARKKDDALADEKRRQEAALQQALLEYRQQQTEHEKRLAQPQPDVVNWQLYQDPELGPVQVNPRDGSYRKLEGLTSPVKPPVDRNTYSDAFGDLRDQQTGELIKKVGRPDPASTAGGGAGTGGRVPVGAQNALVAGAAIEDSLNRYEKASNDYLERGKLGRIASSVGLPAGQDQDIAVAGVESLREEVSLQLKELLNLGVLNGPDMEILTRMLGDASSFSGTIHDPGYTKAKLDNVRTFVKNKVEKYKQFYGAEGGRVAPPDGGAGQSPPPAGSDNPFMGL